MSKNQRIVISITGIVLVMLILVGLTYAYFLTRINGNTNDKSISVTTANLELTYGDNSAEILGKDLVLEPSDTEIGRKTFTVTNNGNDTSYVVIIENVSITKTSDGSTTTFESNDFRYTLTCTKNDGTSCDGVSTQSIFPINGGVLVGNSIKEGDVHTYTFKMWYIDTGIDQSNDMGKTIQARLNITNLSSMTNPYSANTNSLAYNIIENAKNKTNGTELVSAPKTKPAVATSSFIYVKGEDPTSFTLSISNPTNYYISYADDYTVDETTGKFTLVNPTVATEKYTTSMASSLVGKYGVWSTSTPTTSNTQNQSSIYKISTNVSDITSTIKYADIKPEQKSTEKELSATIDDYGTSYYYRGGVEDNYVNFAGMCWKIVRIEGDGSTKLILEDRSAECNSSSYTGNWSDGNKVLFGYDSNKKADFLNYSGGLADSLKNFQIILETKFGTGKLLNDYLKVDDWCFDHNLTNESLGRFQYYDPRKRIDINKSPTLKCTGTKLNKYKDNTNMYVGTLTADEISFAGVADVINYTHYLMNNHEKSSNLVWWGLSPSAYDVRDDRDYAFLLDEHGYLDYSSVDGYTSGLFSRPSVSLKPNTQISSESGDGTKENPYVVLTD